jgi:multidrug efflux pump subunit AcrA (membrane-fusion protein)
MDNKEQTVKGQPFIKRLGQVLAGQNQADPETEAEDLEKQTKALQARHNLATTAEMLNNPESVQKMREERQNELTKAAAEASKKAEEATDRERERLQKEKDDAEGAAASEQAKREQAEKDLQTQMNQQLLTKIEELKGSKLTASQQLTDYITFFNTLSETFGLPKMGAKPPDTTPHTDPHLTLELEKLKIENSQKQRDHEWKLQKDKQEWDLKLMAFDRDGKFKEKEMEMADKRTQQLFTIPEVIGGAIGKALLGREEGGQTTINQPAQSYRLDMLEGQSGTLDCPKCKTQVGIGPTQGSAQCIKCGTQFMIARKPKEPAAADQVKLDVAEEEE